MKIDPQLKKELQTYITDRIRHSKEKVYIYAPYELGKTEIQDIKKHIPYLHDNDMEVVVDKTVMAGVIIKFGTKMIDLSLKTELQNLKQAIYEIT
jgi:F0F1-type ATP synthase delta subunit